MPILEYLKDYHLPPCYKNPEEEVQRSLKRLFAHNKDELIKTLFWRKEENRTKYFWPYFRLDRFYKDIMSNVTYPIAYKEKIFGEKTYEILELLRMFKNCNIMQIMFNIYEFDPENLISKAFLAFYKKILKRNVEPIEIPFLYENTIYYYPFFSNLDYNTTPLWAYTRSHKTQPYINEF